MIFYLISTLVLTVITTISFTIRFVPNRLTEKFQNIWYLVGTLCTLPLGLVAGCLFQAITRLS